jgi:predicted nucleotidyltransferase
MNRSATIASLRQLEPELRAQGIAALYLFGSVARGEESAASDVDVLFDIQPDCRFSLFDQAHISRELSERLNRRVDFVHRSALHPLLRSEVEAQKILVF